MISMARNNISNLISGAVGAGAKASNNPKDVKIIQYLFNIIAAAPNLFPETGICNQDLILKIKRFQLQDLRFPVADGRIDPAGKSLKALVEKAQQKRPLRNDLNNSSQAYLFGGAWCGGGLPPKVSNIMAILGFKSSFGLDKNSGTPHRAVVDSYLMLNSKSIPTQDNALKKSIERSNTSSNKLQIATIRRQQHHWVTVFLLQLFKHSRRWNLEVAVDSAQMDCPSLLLKGIFLGNIPEKNMMLLIPNCLTNM